MSGITCLICSKVVGVGDSCRLVGADVVHVACEASDRRLVGWQSNGDGTSRQPLYSDEVCDCSGGRKASWDCQDEDCRAAWEGVE